MAKVTRRGAALRVSLPDVEVLLLSDLVDQLAELLRTDDDEALESESDGSIGEVFAGLSWPTAEPVVVPSDPALRRLFPSAYPEDADADAEFRRYTDTTQRADMRSDIELVRAGLATISTSGQTARGGRAGHGVLDDEQAQAWLRVINRLRLVLATRLGIETADDQGELDRLADGDPRAAPYLLFGWLGYLLGSLLGALD